MQFLRTQMTALQEDFKTYAYLKLRQLKFEVVEMIAKQRARVLFRVLSLFVLLLVSIFTSLFAAFLLNQLMQSQYLGFAAIAIFWTLVWGICYLFRNNIIRLFSAQFLSANIPEPTINE